MKKVSLIAINARYSHTNLAVLYMREVIKDLPWNCSVLSFTINTPFYDILEGIAEDDPDVIAISCYIWNAELTKLLLPELKKICPKAKIIVGGPEVSYNFQQWLNQFPAIDYIVVGAGEKSFRELLKNDLSYPDKVVNLGAYKFKEIPFPYEEQDFEYSKNKILYYESSRGCPFTCTFCLSSRDDQKLDYRSIEDVKKELEEICSHKPNLIKFVDRSFNAKPKIAREIWRVIMELNTETRFHFELHPLLLQEEDFELLAQAPEGIFQFEIGIQTLNEKSQEVIRRKNHWQRMRPNIERLIGLCNIHIHVDFIAGLPYEDWNSTRDSFNGIYELQAEIMQFGFLKVIPGTPMYYQIEQLELEFIESAPYQILKTNSLNFQELKMLREMEVSLNALYNSEQFHVTEKALVMLHKLPFDAYYALAMFGRDHKHLDAKGFAKIAQWVMHYIEMKFPEKIGYFVDALRWDWAKLFKSRSWPNYLKDDHFGSLKAAEKKLRDLLSLNQLHLPADAMRTGMVFKAFDPDFKIKQHQDYYFFFDYDGKRAVIGLSENEETQAPAVEFIHPHKGNVISQEENRTNYILPSKC
ncbi:MAG: B12-binding domain-containing radical SAM protein [Lentisphaeria bacterium]|nr:B12-binding domain-containing radical SAM protein [Lentisphaeria bacterium]